MPTCHVFEFARSAINSSKVICQESDRFLETLETPLNTPMIDAHRQNRLCRIRRSKNLTGRSNQDVIDLRMNNVQLQHHKVFYAIFFTSILGGVDRA